MNRHGSMKQTESSCQRLFDRHNIHDIHGMQQLWHHRRWHRQPLPRRQDGAPDSNLICLWTHPTAASRVFSLSFPVLSHWRHRIMRRLRLKAGNLHHLYHTIGEPHPNKPSTRNTTLILPALSSPTESTTFFSDDVVHLLCNNTSFSPVLSPPGSLHRNKWRKGVV